MSTTQPQLDPSQIQGLPAGAVLKPVQTQPTPEATDSQIEGLPAGAVLKPVSQSQPSMRATTPADLQSGIGAEVSDVWNRLKRVFTTGTTLNPDVAISTAPYHTPPEQNGGQLPSGTPVPAMQLVTPQAAMTSIEQTKHPIATGIAEFTGGLTSPESVALLAASGGLGELPGLAGKILPRLASAGFSGMQIQSAFKEIPAFRAALADGDSGEAQRILTHMTLGIAAAAMGAQHATTGEPAPESFEGMNAAISDLTNRAVAKARSVGADVANRLDFTKTAPEDYVKQAAIGTAKAGVTGLSKAVAIPGAMAEGAVNLGTKAADAFSKPEDLADRAQKNIIAASRPAQSAFRGYPEVVAKSAPYLQQIHADNADAFSSPQDLSDGIKSFRESVDAKLRDFAESQRDNPDSELTGLRDQVKSGLQKYFDRVKGQYDADEIEPAINSVIKRLDQGGRDPNVFESDNIRRGFNQQTQTQYGANAKQVPAAEIAAKTEAASLLRDAIDKKYSDMGVDNVAEWRTAEKSLIKLEDQLSLGEKNSFGSEKPSIVKSVITEHGPVRGLLSYIDDILHNPDKMTQSAGAKLSKLPRGAAVVPTFTPGTP